ncbi:hypothetical protein ACWGO6_19025, partial [Microbacterium sp. NPDC055665]
LRWQQQQLSSFMAEVKELIRPDGIFSDDSLPTEITGADAPVAPAPAEAVADETPEETFLGDEVLDELPSSGNAG